MPDTFPLVPTSSDFGGQHQVQTRSRNSTKQTGSTNNLAMTQSQRLYLFLRGQVFHWCIRQPQPTPDTSFTQKFEDGGWIPEVVINLRRKTYRHYDLSGCSNVLRHARSTSTGMDIVRHRTTALEANWK